MSVPAEAVVPVERAKKSKNALFGERLSNLGGPFVGLIFVLVMFSINPEVRAHFLTLANFKLVASQTVIVALCALGMTLIIISGGIDLSVGSVIALTSVVAALIIVGGHPVFLAIIAAVALGGFVGAMNGGLITGLRVTPFIVTLGTLGIARGAALWLANEQAVSAPNTWINDLAATFPPAPLWHIGGMWFTLPGWLLVSPGVWLTLGLGVLTSILLSYTVFGRYIVAIGSNETTSRLSGLRVDFLKIAIYGVAGLFFGLAGVLQFGRLGMGDPTVDVGTELDVIAAVVIGGGSLTGGEGSILGSILGALIMALLRNGSQQMGWAPYVEQIIIGVVIVAAVTLDRLRHRAR